MFLHRGLILTFNDHIRVREGIFHIPFADLLQRTQMFELPRSGWSNGASRRIATTGRSRGGRSS